MAIRCRFVDSVSATPTVRLDLNDTTGAGFWLGQGGLQAPPPSLRRAEASTILRDGGMVAASAYDNRMLTLPLTITSAGSMDARNTLVSSLVKELNRESNILEYRPDGSSTSYFFRTFRSPELEPVMWLAKQPESTVQLNLYAEPFAVGLEVAASVVTVKMDPSLTNGCYLDVTGVTGDVLTPAFLKFTLGTGTISPTATNYVAVRRHGTPTSFTFAYQAEAATLGVNTTVPGTDATASGATNNYASTSFGTASVTTRLKLPVGTNSEIRGMYRVLARVKQSASGDVFSIQTGVNGSNPTPLVTVTGSTSWKMVDLGLLQIPTGEDSARGYTGTVPTFDPAMTVDLLAGRTSGAGTLAWDYVVLLPADEETCIFTGVALSLGLRSVVLDGPNDRMNFVDASDRLYGSQAQLIQRAGSIPQLQPGSNRLVILWQVGSAAVGDTVDLTASYWPRYLTV